MLCIREEAGTLPSVIRVRHPSKSHWTRWAVVGLVMAWAAGLASTTSCAADAVWHEVAGARWMVLPIPVSGRVGFSLLTPAETGLAFTNSIDEQSAAANRVLLNGSGVATGDYDNDGWPDVFFCGLKIPVRRSRSPFFSSSAGEKGMTI